MQRSCLVVCLVLLTSIATGVTTAVEAQDRQRDATQAPPHDGRYLIYMRGIT